MALLYVEWICQFVLDTLPIEAKPVWQKQAIELEEELSVTEEPAWVPTLHEQRLKYINYIML